MTKNPTIRKTALICVFLTMGVGTALNAHGQFKAGDRFPDIMLPSLADGQLDSIARYRGSKLILHIFASW